MDGVLDYSDLNLWLQLGAIDVGGTSCTVTDFDGDGLITPSDEINFGDGVDDDVPKGIADDVTGGDTSVPSDDATGQNAIETAHGTAMAGIIGASGSAVCGVSGFAAGANWKVRLLPVRAGAGKVTGPVGAKTLRSEVIKAINYAAQHRPDVINVSLGALLKKTPLTQSEKADPGCLAHAVDNVGKKFDSFIADSSAELANVKVTWPDGTGKSLVVFSGTNCGVQNDALDAYFDIFPEGVAPLLNEADIVAISVSGIFPKRELDKIEDFVFVDGTHGNVYDLGAPAQDVVTLGTFVSFDDSVQIVKGVSAAAAMVSGALGLMIAKDLSLKGKAGTLRDRLLCNSPDSGLPNLSNGGKKLDAFQAVTNANQCP